MGSKAVPAVHVHTLLAYHGGAARMAKLVAQGAEESGIAISRTCEIADGSVNPPIIEPASLAAHIPEQRIVHVHASQDWNGCLSSLAIVSLPTVITLHDCSLITGGCPHPLECPGWRDGCFDPCPRNFPNAIKVQQERRDLVMQLAPRLVTPSRWLRKMVKTVFPDIPCKVIPNGVEEPDISLSREEAKAKLGVRPDARMVLFVAHGGEQAVYKLGGSWLAMWEQLQAAVPNAVCFMVGGQEHSQQGNLVRLPYVDRATMQRILAAADLLLYPTLADNHPLVVLEAMAAGLPVVATSVGGVPEIVEHESTGVLVPEGSHEQFVKQGIRLLSSARLLREFSQAAKARFNAHFTQARMVKDYVRFYQALYAERF